MPSRDEKYVSRTEAQVLQSIIEGYSTFTKIRETLGVSDEYVARVLKKMITKGLLDQHTKGKPYSIPSAKTLDALKLIMSRFDSLFIYSRVLPGLVKQIESFDDAKSRKEWYVRVILQSACLPLAEFINSMMKLKDARNRRKTNANLRRTPDEAMSSMLRRIDSIVQSSTFIDQGILSTVVDILRYLPNAPFEELYSFKQKGEAYRPFTVQLY